MNAPHSDVTTRSPSGYGPVGGPTRAALERLGGTVDAWEQFHHNGVRPSAICHDRRANRWFLPYIQDPPSAIV